MIRIFRMGWNFLPVQDISIVAAGIYEPESRLAKIAQERKI